MKGTPQNQLSPKQEFRAPRHRSAFRFLNWVAFDATTGIVHLIELGARPSDFEDRSTQRRRAIPFPLSRTTPLARRGSALRSALHNFLMKSCLIAVILAAGAAYGSGADRVTNTARPQTWHSASALETAARDYARQHGIKFTFEGTTNSIFLRRVGTNTVATVDFFSGFGKPCFTIDIDQTGRVLTNSLAISVCGTGQNTRPIGTKPNPVPQ